jgi:hypothetical protein
MDKEYRWMIRDASSILEYDRRHLEMHSAQFKRPPKGSVDPLSCMTQQHVQGGLMQSLCSMYSIVSKDGAKTQPSDSELLQVGDKVDNLSTVRA